MANDKPIDANALSKLYEARENAKRYNRNLLQYAAGLAALLGIVAGTSGVYALAYVQEAPGAIPESVEAILTVVAAACTVGCVTALLGTIFAYVMRLVNERAAAGALDDLVREHPEHFLPKPEDLL